MKRLTALLLLICLLLGGCADRLNEPVTFYYVRTDYQEDMDSIIASERREAAGHRKDLSYLLALYFMGPTTEELTAPLPKTVNLLSATLEGGAVTLVLTDTADTLSDSRFSLACACLSLTCMDITLAESVTIESGERTVTMTKDNLVLLDSATDSTVEKEMT